MPWNELDEASAAAISEIAETKDGLKIKLHDKIAAIRLLVTQLGMFQTNVKLGGDEPNPLVAFIQDHELAPRHDPALADTP